jgi:tetratricopeptide (TPR) repeat protein
MPLLRQAAAAALLAAGLLATLRAQSADPAVERGFAALQRGDADAAAGVFRAALAQRPRDAELLFGAGAAAHLQGREDEAASLLRQAVQIEPRLTPAALLLGEIAYRRGDLDLAIKTYEQVLTQTPANMGVRERLQAWRAEAEVEGRFEAYRDDRFTIMFDGPAQQNLAAHATATMGAAFNRIAATLGSAPPAQIRVVFYTTQQFHDITGAPDWADGGFDGQIRLPLGGASQDLAAFDRVLRHELTHAMLHSIAPRNVPAWLHEGLAMQFEPHDAATARKLLAAARAFVPLAALQEGFSRLSAAEAAVAYEESAVAARALLDRIGPQGLADLLQDLDRGLTIEQAIQRFGFTLAAFEAELSQQVGVRPAPRRR